MLDNMQPVTDMESIAVDRQGLALEQPLNQYRNQLLRKLSWTIIIAAIGRDSGQSIGSVI